MRQKERYIEAQVLLEVRNGDQKAFELLFNHYKDRIFAYSYKILKSKDLADDATIEVFVKIWNKRASIQPGLAFQAYLFKTAKNHIINLLNKASLDQKLQNHLLESACSKRSNTEEEVIYNQYLALAEEAIQSMPNQRRRVFSLRKQGMTYQQIATELDISVNTVKSHLKQANSYLRKLLNFYPEKTAMVLMLLLF